jgi:hypothetical protein
MDLEFAVPLGTPIVEARRIASSTRMETNRCGRLIAPIPDRALFGSSLGLASQVTGSVGAFVQSGSEYRTRHRAGR